MHRRDALRTVTILSLSAVAGCDSAQPSPASTTTSSTAENAARPPLAPETSSATRVLPDEVRHGPRDRPQVALTFHDQGEFRTVTALLDELKRGGAQVTVLAVGTWLAANAALSRRVLADMRTGFLVDR